MAQRSCAIEGCDKPAKASRGWCWMHYYRWRRNGNPLDYGALIVGDDVVRFWSKVDKDGPIPEHRPELGPCWLWIGGANDGGYGIFGVGGKSVLAHRWAFLEFVEETDLDIVSVSVCGLAAAWLKR